MARKRLSQRSSQRVLEDSGSEDDVSGSDGPIARPEMQEDKNWDLLEESVQEEYAKVIVRTMLCKHAVKGPVKRSDLSKLLFANGAVKSRSSILNGAIKLAKVHLANVFACEMIEVVKQTRATRKQSASASRATVTATQASRDGTQSFGIGAKAYILVSTLPPGARPECKSEWATRAFLAIVASIILLEPGCRILEEDLFRALETAAGVKVAESGGHKQLNGGNVDELLKKTFLQQWYLEREKDDRSVYYTLGPRLRAELSDADLLSFVNAVYNLDANPQTQMDPMTKRELMERLDAARGIELAPEGSDDE